MPPPTDYGEFPRTLRAKQFDAWLPLVKQFLDEPKRPEGFKDDEWRAIFRFASQFVLDGNNTLWKKHELGLHQIVVEPEKRPTILPELHDRVGHRGLFATRHFVCERFWWPDIKKDVHWYVKSCHKCQLRQTTKIHIPPTVPVPACPMVRIHVDSATLPGRYRYLVHARCATTSWPEARALTAETGIALGEWLYELVCRWCALSEIISDNGTPWVNALEHIGKKYHIRHIRVSGYNSQANGVVERAHFTLRDVLVKATEGDGTKWHSRLQSALWSERVTCRRRMGCSPYFAVTGSHPVLPFDFVEATYLVPPPGTVLTTEQLITQRAIALQKRAEDVAQLRSTVFKQRVQAALEFEKRFAYTTKNFYLASGRLVLVRNSAIEKSLDKKMKWKYTGPYVVVRRNKGGAYILSELDGTVFDRPTAAFRVIPYLARTRKLEIPDEWLDTSEERMQELEESEDPGEGAVDMEGDEEDES